MDHGEKTGVAPGRKRTVVIVDDHRTFAELLADAISANANFDVVGVATSGQQGIDFAMQAKADLVVMDIEMPREDGLSATRRLKAMAPQTVVAIVTAHRDPEWVARAAQAGASAFIPKDGTLAEMLAVLEEAKLGEMTVARSTFREREPLLTGAPRAEDFIALTRREQEVLNLLGQGLQLKAIARILGITLETARGYTKSLMSKLGARSQLEAVLKAQRLSLMDSEVD
jgi:DNA-binding NarL/FixJ family response regulator